MDVFEPLFGIKIKFSGRTKVILGSRESEFFIGNCEVRIKIRARHGVEGGFYCVWVICDHLDPLRGEFEHVQ